MSHSLTTAAAPQTGSRITVTNGLLEVVVAHDPGSSVRVVRWGVPGAADLPGDQPAVEVVTVDSGHTPALTRLVGGTAGNRLRYRSHELVRTGRTQVLTVVQAEDDGDLVVELRLELTDGAAAARARTRVVLSPDAAAPRALLSVTSLALDVGAGPDAVGDPSQLHLARAASAWLAEGRWSTAPLRHSGLPDVSQHVHTTAARGCVAQASTGSWSTGHALPTGVLVTQPRPEGDDGGGGSRGGALAWQIEHSGGWRWEVGEHRRGAYLALSGPNDADHAWSTVLSPGTWFETVPATVAVGEDLTDAIAELTAHRRAVRRPHPDAQRLPVVFNDYMNTLMGDPTTDKLLPLVAAAAEAGAEVFCIDAGWYDDGGDWWTSVGQWEPSTTRFPGGGLSAVLEEIRSRGMVAGLWLEPEVVGVDSPVADRLPEDAFLRRHGQRLVEHGRYHLDLRHPAAVAHLDAVVDKLVALGAGFFKLDYNINPGPGTDVACDSPGDGLLQHARAHRDWLVSVLDRHPDLVLENCGSGAMRADAAVLEVLQLQSTSDQQDPVLYPPIAASAALSVPLEQAASWAYPQADMDDEAIAFTCITGMLGRLYLSGYLNTMSISQQTLVAEAVAAHKRLRGGLTSARASWPLGIDQWDSPWVALVADAEDEAHLALWRRPGASGVVDLPLPQHIGQDLHVEQVFPARLEAWQWSWDRDLAVLRVTATTDAPSARLLRLTRGPAVERVSIDLADLGEPVHGGASGMLYGLSEEGVPTRALLEGAAPRTVAQKPPGGAQHPGGDALEVADSFFACGGQELLVYLQDALEQWPYEDVGIEALCDIARSAVGAVADHPDRHRFTWVPFNEGDWIWYADWSPTGRSRFLADWDAAVAAIRAVDPTARVAGPNEARYQPTRVRDFLTHARGAGTLPDVMTWHELQPSCLETFPAHLAHYRALERELGVGPLPVNVDEYGNKRDTSVPARLLAWLDLLETAKVDGDLAYWTAAGNLDDHTAGTGANAGWWLLHWYASLRGRTAAVSVPHPGVRDSSRALAAHDADGATATVLVGGSARAVDLQVSGLDVAAGLAGHDTLRVRTSAVSWSGYEGELPAPDVLSDEVHAVEPASSTGTGSVLRLRLPATDPTAVLRVDVTPDGGGAPAPTSPWSVLVAVDDARVAECPTRRHGDDAQEHAGTGRRGVSGTPSADSSLDFPVTVPTDGAYVLSVGYGTDSAPARLALSVDGGPVRVVRLPPTLSRTYTGRCAVVVTLSAGPHRIRWSTRDAQGGHLADSDVAIDHLHVAASDTGPARHDAVLARRSPGARVIHEGAISGSGAVVLPEGEHLVVFASTAASGAHRVRLRRDATPGAEAVLVFDGREVALEGGADAAEALVALPRGLVALRVLARVGQLTVHHLELLPEEGAGEQVVLTADELELHGGAHTRPRVQGAGTRGVAGLVVDGLDGDGSVTAALPGTRSGPHLVALVASNALRRSGHVYNADIITRVLRVDAGAGVVEVPVPHTKHWESFEEFCAVLDVVAGAPLRITGTGADDPGPRLATVSLAALHQDGPRP